MSMRIISLDGHLGGDAELKQTKDGKPYVKFSLANNIFVNGQKVTDWFDVNCYDPFVVTNKIKVLKKGKYVIVTGNIRTVVNNNNGKLWLNHYVTAINIDAPDLGKPKEETEDTPSVYTGGTQSQVYSTAKQDPIPAYEPIGEQDDGYNGDDMPF